MPETAEAVATKGRILVIDDEADIRESLETLLDMEGYAVQTAENGAQGLKKVEAGIFDLILLYLMMPDRSCLDVLDDIRSRDKEMSVFMIIERPFICLKNGRHWEKDHLSAYQYSSGLVVMVGLVSRQDTCR